MKSEYVAIAAFCCLAGLIYFYFEDQKREETLLPIKKNVIANQHPLVLHFYSDSSATCKAYELVLKKTLRPYENTIDCQDLNIGIENNNRLLHNCGAGGVPTTVIFDRKGNKIAKETGFLRADELDKLLRQAVSHR